MTIYQRFLRSKIEVALLDTPVVCLLGARQVGKSTLCQQLAPDRTYLTFDDQIVLNAAKNDPDGFIQSLPEFVTLDEVQRVPEILLSIKAEVDRNRKPGRFLLTGSANLLILPKVKESLTGRIEILYLHPLTEAEKENTPSRLLDLLFRQQLKSSITGTQREIEGIARRVCKGGYPEPNLRTAVRAEQWFEQYLQTIIKNDVADVADIKDEDDLLRLAKHLALRTGKLLNTSSIANELKIGRDKTDKYISILEHLFLAYRLPGWHNNLSKRAVKAPKLHLVDSGLAVSLNSLKVEDWYDFSTDFGPLLESFVIQQIRAQVAWSDETIRLSHYRDKDKVEVDLVIEQGRDVYGIEVKKSISIQRKDGEGLKRLASQTGKHFKGGLLIYCGSNAISLQTPNCIAAPIDWLWRKR